MNTMKTMPATVHSNSVKPSSAIAQAINVIRPSSSRFLSGSIFGAATSHLTCQALVRQPLPIRLFDSHRNARAVTVLALVEPMYTLLDAALQILRPLGAT
jgi:hypothetical protein